MNSLGFAGTIWQTCATARAAAPNPFSPGGYLARAWDWPNTSIFQLLTRSLRTLPEEPAGMASEDRRPYLGLGGFSSGTRRSQSAVGIDPNQQQAFFGNLRRGAATPSTLARGGRRHAQAWLSAEAFNVLRAGLGRVFTAPTKAAADRRPW